MVSDGQLGVALVRIQDEDLSKGNGAEQFVLLVQIEQDRGGARDQDRRRREYPSCALAQALR